MCNIGYVYAHAPQSLAYALYREGIVEVLGIVWVDGECHVLTHIAALGYLFLSDARLYLLSCLFHILGIDVWQAKFSQDGMHLRIIFASHAKYVHHLAHRAIGGLGPIHYLHHCLVASLAVFKQFLRDKYVGSQEFAVGDKVAVVVVDLERAYKHLLLSLQNLEHLSLGFAVRALSADMDLHLVAIERVL